MRPLACLLIASCTACTVAVDEAEPIEEVGQQQHTLTFAQCDGSVLVQIDGTHDASYDGTTNYVHDNGTSFNPALKGPFPTWDPDYYQRAWFSPSLTYHGLPSLTYQLRRCSQTGDCSGYTTQKIHHHFLKSTSNLISVASPARRYVGFAFRVDSDSEPSEDLGQINGTPLVFQLWQGSPHRPPFAAHLVPEGGDASSLVFTVRSNTVGGGSGYDSDNGHEIGRIPMPTDTWHEFVLAFYPEPDEDSHQTGNVTVGIHHRLKGQSTWGLMEYYGKWTYNTTNPGCPYVGDCSIPDPNTTVDFKFGLYKSTNSYTKHKVSFANLKQTTQWAYADPTYLCTDTY